MGGSGRANRFMSTTLLVACSALKTGATISVGGSSRDLTAC